MTELKASQPTYILFQVDPHYVFEELFLFKDLSNFFSRRYDFVQKFGNVLVFKMKDFQDEEETTLPGVSLPLELVKRYSAITRIANDDGQTIIDFEPMVSPSGVLERFKSFYPYFVKIDFLPLVPQIMEIGEKDLVRVKGLPKPVNFVRIKIGGFTWNNQSYGVNPVIEVKQKNDIFDLFFGPVVFSDKQEMEIYFIYEDGDLARTEVELTFQENQ